MPAPPSSTEPKQARAHATRRRLLDAAVDELLDRGYSGLTTPAVARRAGVSRGAQQNYFPHKATLVVAAVRHLAARQLEELRDQLSEVPSGADRVRAGLDVLFEQYSGRLFACVIELSLASRADPQLREVISAEERAISDTVRATATLIFGEGFPASREDAARWGTALAAIRGLALLRLLGHSARSVERQWQATRAHLLGLLDEPESG
ncbi:MAG TPA: TetR/AcrR family transcriptional regulator [Solirubrobacteraceae bacterium]|nr:TetR/AcrR family transcriptional regulator [Solirubrobacteraceae bacterium]